MEGVIIDQKSLKEVAKTIRVISAEAVQRANSGHPGLPMGAADYAAVLWSYFLRFNPSDLEWQNRDRFVLSAGHGSMLLYSLLHLFGYDLPISEIKNFRQWDSKTPGHPEFGLTVGVDTTTGPLGQGFANGVGLALSGKMLAARYGSDLFDHRVFGIVSDGDLMEGIASEAASLAGHLKLGNINYIYDDNKISIGGSTDVCFTEDVGKRFESYGWHVQHIDGHDLAAAAKALESAVNEKSQPSLIIAHTTIGFGSPAKAGSAGAHGEPLGAEELKATKKNLGWEREEFSIAPEVLEFCAGCNEERSKHYSEWKSKFNTWRSKNPELAAQFDRQSARVVPPELKSDLLAAFSPANAKKNATRNLSGDALQLLAKHLPGFVGGSADLEPSNKSLIKGSSDISVTSFEGRNIRFGVREHAMGAVANGLAYTRAWIPYTATFLVFSDYMRPSIRLAALSHLQSLFIFTHDSFWVGEDGPTHQPIEHIASLRLIPNLHVYRPADGMETALSYYAAVSRRSGPSVLLFTRQNLEPLNREDLDLDLILRGGYVVSGKKESSLCIIATGSEVPTALQVQKDLLAAGTASRVVSIPCLEIFMAQDRSYRDSVIPPASKKVSLEAGTTIGWERIIGSDGLAIGIDHFGASAPGEVLSEKFGFTPDKVREMIIRWLASSGR